MHPFVYGHRMYPRDEIQLEDRKWWDHVMCVVVILRPKRRRKGRESYCEDVLATIWGVQCKTEPCHKVLKNGIFIDSGTSWCTVIMP
ncbi:hypothetical protein WN55_08731 [Dufourea novaeangliae]|uniref:Uncharacterized protein n=1 Tax=Dufourea novaeangliae TaxID=178035 RepID=A0A154P199_DUFNO|nr:hypothetical protein WN55_08731 [Dufourea novaeangliae]